MNKKKILCFCLALGAFSAMMAQETLSLSQCLQMAVYNNLSLQKSRNEIAKGKYSISENQAKLLPHLQRCSFLCRPVECEWPLSGSGYPSYLRQDTEGYHRWIYRERDRARAFYHYAYGSGDSQYLRFLIPGSSHQVLQEDERGNAFCYLMQKGW